MAQKMKEDNPYFDLNTCLEGFERFANDSGKSRLRAHSTARQITALEVRLHPSDERSVHGIVYLVATDGLTGEVVTPDGHHHLITMKRISPFNQDLDFDQWVMDNCAYDMLEFI